MSTITVTNNTKLPIHIATQWSNIVQEYCNHVEPGNTVELPAAGFGWQDFFAVTGSPDNEISHGKDWVAVLGLGATILGTLGTIAGIAAIPLTGGASAVVAAGSAAIAMTAGGTAAGVVSTIAGLAVSVGEFVVNPATVSGLWGPDGYTMNVTGGDIEVAKLEDGSIKITRVLPLSVTWQNKKSGTVGVATSKR